MNKELCIKVSKWNNSTNIKFWRQQERKKELREESQRNKRSNDFPLMEGYMVVW